MNPLIHFVGSWDFCEDPILLARFAKKELAGKYVVFLANELNMKSYVVCLQEDYVVVCGCDYICEFPDLKRFPRIDLDLEDEECESLNDLVSFCGSV